jgi:hypothetical protein
MGIKVFCDNCGAECVYEDGYSKLQREGKDSDTQWRYLCKKCTQKIINDSKLDTFKWPEAKK